MEQPVKIKIKEFNFLQRPFQGRRLRFTSNVYLLLIPELFVTGTRETREEVIVEAIVTTDQSLKSVRTLKYIQ